MIIVRQQLYASIPGDTLCKLLRRAVMLDTPPLQQHLLPCRKMKFIRIDHNAVQVKYDKPDFHSFFLSFLFHYNIPHNHNQ